MELCDVVMKIQSAHYIHVMKDSVNGMFSLKYVFWGRWRYQRTVHPWVWRRGSL